MQRPIWVLLDGGPFEPRFYRVEDVTFRWTEPSAKYPGVFYQYESLRREAEIEDGAIICRLRFIARIDGRELPIDHKHNAE